MWIVELFSRGIKSVHHLVGGCEYTVGCEGCDILVREADRSVSRRHITLSSLTFDASQQRSPNEAPTLLVIDHSKHGTTVCDVRLYSGDRRKVAHGDTVVLGRTVRLVVWYSPLVVCLSSSLSSVKRQAVIDAVGRIGGTVLEELRPHEQLQRELVVSPFMTAFCTDALTNETNALFAMLFRYSLVTPEYITTLYTVLRDTPSISLRSLPQPVNADALRPPLLADAPYCRPDPAMFGLREFHQLIPAEPSAVLRRVHMLFVSHDAATDPLVITYRSVLEAAGATVSILAPMTVKSWLMRYSAAVAASSPKRSGGSHSFVRRPYQHPTEERPSAVLPLRGLVDIEHAHGRSTYVVAPANIFSTVVDRVSRVGGGRGSSGFGGGSPLHRSGSGADQLGGSLCGSFAASSMGSGVFDALGDDCTGEGETDGREVLFMGLWRRHVKLLHEDNLFVAMYSGDGASQLGALCPGVLCRKEMAAARAQQQRSSSGSAGRGIAEIAQHELRDDVDTDDDSVATLENIRPYASSRLPVAMDEELFLQNAGKQNGRGGGLGETMNSAGTGPTVNASGRTGTATTHRQPAVVLHAPCQVIPRAAQADAVTAERARREAEAMAAVRRAPLDLYSQWVTAMRTSVTQ